MSNVIDTLCRTKDCGPEILSFVGNSGSMWSPERSGNYARDCATGRLYASELAEYVRLTGRLHTMSFVAQAIAASGEWGGVEIGFFTGISAAMNEAD